MIASSGAWDDARQDATAGACQWAHPDADAERSAAPGSDVPARAGRERLFAQSQQPLAVELCIPDAVQSAAQSLCAAAEPVFAEERQPLEAVAARDVQKLVRHSQALTVAVVAEPQVLP